ncbi:hypothetical protein JCM11491_000965 [Sporobolomyces phaffii]
MSAPTLFFGVFIKSLALCFAADAYDAQRRTLLAIDLVCARRRTDRLAFRSSPSPLARFPDEVWSLVQQQLIHQALEDVEYFNDARYDCGCSLSRRSSSTPPKRWTRQHFEQCPKFSDMFRAQGGLATMLKRRSEKINSLLDAFGLVLPLDSYHRTLADEETNIDLDALEALGIALRQSYFATARPSAARMFLPSRWKYDGIRSYSVTTISLSALAPNLDIALRLDRLVARFNLAVENPSGLTLVASVARPPPPDPSSRRFDVWVEATKGSSTEKHRLACCPDPLTAPHWHLVTEFKYEE